MGLSPEEKEQLAALQAKENEPDPADDFEIEIGEGGKYARLPYSKGKSWLGQFGIQLDPPANDSGTGDGDKPEPKQPGKQKAKGSGTAPETADPGYWTKRRSG